jgi:hypothetical protein
MRKLFYVLLGTAVFLVLFIPAKYLRPKVGAAAEFEADGYFVSYKAPLYGKQFPVRMFIAEDSAGNCHVANVPDGWDTGLCAVRLRQIAAMNCAAAPAHDDDHCHAMPLGAGKPGERRAARALFVVREGLPTQAVEVGNAPKAAEKAE